MSITKVIGGNRVGSGKKMKVQLHGYDRSTHDLSTVWRSTLAPGTLVPFYVNVGLNGDTFDIDLNAIVRTLPTNAPLFGSFKMQLDLFGAPLRLYNGTLHNNPLNVGMKMQEIPFQKLTIYHNAVSDKYRDFDTCQINPSSLLHYLGLSGLGMPDINMQQQEGLAIIEKTINATPILAYYDIFKNYYANKQEGLFYWIGNRKNEFDNAVLNSLGVIHNSFPYKKNEIEAVNNEITAMNEAGIGDFYIITGTGLTLENVVISKPGLTETKSIAELTEQGYIAGQLIDNNEIFFTSFEMFYNEYKDSGFVIGTDGNGEENRIELKSCELEALDRVRELCLMQTNAYDIEHGYPEIYQITSKFGIDWFDEMLMNLPYFSNERDKNKPNNSIYSQYGLCVKTYQNDMFNNWLDKEIIDGDNGISTVTTVDTSDGLNLDALNLAQKVYNMLNRIAISGGTYQDWQEVQYGEKVIRLAETPIYYGGASYEIGFEEVVSTTDNAAQDGKELGGLAGKGTIINADSEHIVIHIEEPTIIMGIVSITPRIDYSQGNKWYLTELLNYGDLHVPALDTIGYQNLKAEQLAWFGQGWQEVDGAIVRIDPSVGKLPAWINYMTAVNEVHGDFAIRNKMGYMVLTRKYEGNRDLPRINDITSYIDPQKYNYAFSDPDLYAQNFWVQIGMKIEARRKMSAKIIPNL